jgi:hypothetical protein
LPGTGRRQRHDDAGLLLDDSGSELDEVQTQRVELGAAPRGTLRASRAELPPDPVGAAMQHQSHLIGVGFLARRPVGRDMGLPRLNVVLGLASGGVDFFIKMLATATLEIGDDVACVPPLGADLDPGNHPAGF